MTRKRVSTGSPFEEKFAYSRAVAVGNMCFVAGTTGYDYAKMEMPEDPAQQTRNIFETIGKALAEADFVLSDITRLQVTVTDVAHWNAAAPVVREYFGDIRPANTTVIGDLIAPEMKIEIEATAVKS